MVVFSCGECGEAMKKAQVENHYQRKCRNCNVLSCLDCGKDFWGKDYEQHTKCISEEEKYSGKNYVAKPGANKGEVKQQRWLQEVQNAIDKVKTNPKLKDVLERMKPYENIPRKKAKFENFLKNSLRVYDKRLASQVWDLVMTNTEKPKPADSDKKQNGNNTSNESTQQQNGHSDRLEAPPDSAQPEEGTKKLSKREKKEERRKKLNKAEKKDKQINGDDGGETIEGKKKSKKRKKQDSDEEEQIEEEEVKHSKKRKRETEVSENEENEEEESSEPQKKIFKTKFNWNEVIKEVLQSKGEMKLKKLRRKVLAEYLAQGCTAKSEEKLWAKFDSKLKKNPAVKVLHDKAKMNVS